MTTQISDKLLALANSILMWSKRYYYFLDFGMVEKNIIREILKVLKIQISWDLFDVDLFIVKFWIVFCTFC